MLKHLSKCVHDNFLCSRRIRFNRIPASSDENNYFMQAHQELHILRFEFPCSLPCNTRNAFYAIELSIFVSLLYAVSF